MIHKVLQVSIIFYRFNRAVVNLAKNTQAHYIISNKLHHIISARKQHRELSRRSINTNEHVTQCSDKFATQQTFQAKDGIVLKIHITMTKEMFATGLSGSLS